MPEQSMRKKSKGSDFRVYVGTSFPNPIFCEIESLSKQHGFAAAQVVRELFLRGLAAYRRDGRLIEVAEGSDALATAAQAEPIEIAA